MFNVTNTSIMSFITSLLLTNRYFEITVKQVQVVRKTDQKACGLLSLKDSTIPLLLLPQRISQETFGRFSL